MQEHQAGPFRLRLTLPILVPNLGTSSIANYNYSLYCNYTTATLPPNLSITSSSIWLGNLSGSMGTFDITSNTDWNISDDAGGWLTITPGSGTNNETISVTANSANTGTIPRTATVTISGTGVTDQTVTVTQDYQANQIGNTTVYGLSAVATTLRAIPVNFTEAGEIQSISIYHEGGTGNVMLGVYSDQTGSPSSLLGVTAETMVNPTAGWQTVSLTNPLTVSFGQTLWLSFVFQNNVNVRYNAGTPGRAISPTGNTANLPATFGTSSIANYNYSLYCNYTTATLPPNLSITSSSIWLGNLSGSMGTFDIASNTDWTISDDAGGWLTITPGSGTNNETISVTANSANTGTIPRTATVTITGTGVTNQTVTVTQDYQANQIGNTTVYGLSAVATTLRAIPVNFTEAGEIHSISIYHDGGTGNVMLGVYSDQTGSPSSLLGVAAETMVNSTAGWQTVSLTNPLTVSFGQTVWLSFVFQNNVNVRYNAGTPGRAISPTKYTANLPATFGTSSIANYNYSLYCNYTTATLPPNLSITSSNVSLGYLSGSMGTFDIASNTDWTISDDAGGWLTITPGSGTNNETISVIANSANTGTISRTATVTISGTGVTNQTVTVTQDYQANQIGNTTVYGLSAVANNPACNPC